MSEGCDLGQALEPKLLTCLLRLAYVYSVHTSGLRTSRPGGKGLALSLFRKGWVLEGAQLTACDPLKASSSTNHHSPRPPPVTDPAAHMPSTANSSATLLSLGPGNIIISISLKFLGGSCLFIYFPPNKYFPPTKFSFG